MIVAAVVVAVVRPTPGPFNQTLVALPILLPYEVGVLPARLA
jgi:Sec-independent protein secretion pathway component TatC